MNDVEFHKYQGTGNDFVIIQGVKSLSTEQIKRLCDRKFGIGADGVILINPSKEHDFDMFYYNSDGSASFCGNGSRCAVQYANHMGLCGTSCIFHSNDGVHEAHIENNWVYLKMHDVGHWDQDGEHFEINTGSPHYIIFTDHIDKIDVVNKAQEVRYSEPYQNEGINVNFLELEGDILHIRTYERGVEDETLSCGTGVTAAAIAQFIKSNKSESQFEQKVQTLGGELSVKFEYKPAGFQNIYLCGPAEFVFEGRITL
ncbi:diaminopimelate epimerase [bacterium]|nr:diaminopimelate epimerase [bacterium]